MEEAFEELFDEPIRGSEERQQDEEEYDWFRPFNPEEEETNYGENKRERIDGDGDMTPETEMKRRREEVLRAKREREEDPEEELEEPEHNSRELEEAVLNLGTIIASHDLARWVVTGEGMPLMKLEEYREQRIEGDYKVHSR